MHLIANFSYPYNLNLMDCRNETHHFCNHDVMMFKKNLCFFSKFIYYTCWRIFLCASRVKALKGTISKTHVSLFSYFSFFWFLMMVFRSTLHRVLVNGQERYSVRLFISICCSLIFLFIVCDQHLTSEVKQLQQAIVC